MSLHSVPDIISWCCYLKQVLILRWSPFLGEPWDPSHPHLPSRRLSQGPRFIKGVHIFFLSFFQYASQLELFLWGQSRLLWMRFHIWDNMMILWLSKPPSNSVLKGYQTQELEVREETWRRNSPRNVSLTFLILTHLSLCSSLKLWLNLVSPSLL